MKIKASKTFLCWGNMDHQGAIKKNLNDTLSQKLANCKGGNFSGEAILKLKIIY